MPTTETGKSPLRRSNHAARARGWMLKTAAIILLIAAFAWVFTYTNAVGTSTVGGKSQSIDPGATTSATSSSGR